MRKIEINTEVEIKDPMQADQVKKAFQLMVANFGAKGIIKMAQLFKSDPFVRSVVKRKLK